MDKISSSGNHLQPGEYVRCECVKSCMKHQTTSKVQAPISKQEDNHWNNKLLWYICSSLLINYTWFQMSKGSYTLTCYILVWYSSQIPFMFANVMVYVLLNVTKYLFASFFGG
jgi:hypothetical protein